MQLFVFEKQKPKELFCRMMRKIIFKKKKITFKSKHYFFFNSGSYFFQEELEEYTPDATDSATTTKEYLHGKTVSASTFQREFELEDVLDYVKTGIASIIEDEVTQRFDSEELKV